ncbi:MAG TPA: SBBP repeat-containing protein, partial [Bryobacteraceae bacterium]|nr:SBBP repeat-containing protein [Bryobacteraceae bacterium]
MDAQEWQTHYLIGGQEEWHTNVPVYGRVECRGVYPGVNVVYYGDASRRLEYDLVVDPRAETSQIRLRFEGAERIETDANGDIVLRTPTGEWRHSNPQIYQLRNGVRQKVTGRFVASGPDEIGFEIHDYDHSRPLTIDPTLTFSTYLGGSGQDSATSIAVDTAGNAYVTGWTESLDFPEMAGPRLGNPSGVDAYVAKLSPVGSLLYVTYLGGSGDDRGYGIAVDSSGEAVVAGWTYSSNFPTWNAAQPGLGGVRDGFVAKLNSAGTALIFSTYLGGNAADSANAVALDQQGNIYVAGETASANFPVLNGFQARIGGGLDAFVTKFNSAGTRLYGTYLGGIADDRATAIAVDTSGNPYITGSTYSTNFPVANAFQSTVGGGQDAFAAKVGPAGNTLVYSTYLGGNGGGASSPETGNGIAVDSAGCAYVAGTTSSSNFPTVNPFQSSLSGSQDAFVLKLSASGGALVYSTYLGGSSIDMATAIAADSTGRAYVAGYTASVDFPIANAVQTSGAGGYDAFLVELTALGNSIAIGTYLGGTGSDSAYGIALDASGNVYLAGQTMSVNFPLLNAVQTVGSASGFIERFSFSSPSNLALGKPATESSTLAAAGEAVDGNTDGNYFDGSVSHTGLDANAWWQVDLGSSAVISSIVVWNRTDCCGDRLANYWVFASNTPFAATDTPA